MLYNLMKKVAMLVPPIKRLVIYNHLLESRVGERDNQIYEIKGQLLESENMILARNNRISELELSLTELNEAYSVLKHEFDERWDWILKLENDKKELRLKTIEIADFASGEYWENRYANGVDSGSGSYSRLADFKSETVNSLIQEFGIKSIVDFGCGGGNQLGMLSIERYVGVDASETIIARHREKYANDMSKSFFHLSQRELYINTQCDASLSQDVIYHLLEQDVFEKYMDDLFNSTSNIVIIYSSNHESYTPWAEYRHRNFTHYVQTNHSAFELLRYIPNKYPYIIGQEDETSASDYYIYKRTA